MSRFSRTTAASASEERRFASALSTSPHGLRWLRSGATWAVGGALACATTYTLYRHHVNPYGEHDFWHSNPLYVGFRAGGVALWLAAASFFAGRARRLDRGLAILARHSLFAYVAHLLILYGSFPVPGFVHVLGRDSLSIPEATAASLLLIGLTVALIVTWRHVQHTRLIPNGFRSLTRLLARCDIRALALRAWTKGTPSSAHSEGSLAAARHDEPPVHAPLGSVSPSPRSS